jgi:trk system potassium uptake protein TrkA
VHIIVVGCGDVGSQLAILLSADGHDVVVIDKDQNAFKRLGPTFNGLKIVGFGFDEDALKQADIERCEAFAAVTNDDSSNMMAAEVASRIYGVSRVVARIFDSQRVTTLQELGLDYICTSTMVAQTILDRLVEGYGHHLFLRGDLRLIEFIAGPGVDNKRLVDIQIPSGFRICLVTREGSSFIPWRETILKEHDTLLAVVKGDAHEKIKRYIRKA